MYRAHRGALSDLPQHHGQRRPPDARANRARRSVGDPRGSDGHAGVRLDGASGVEHRRGVHRRSPTESGSSIFANHTCTWSATACRSIGCASGTSSRSTYTRCPIIRIGSPTARATTRKTGASALRTATSIGSRRARFGWSSDRALTEGSLTYGETVIPGTSEREVLFFNHVCHPSLCNDNLSGNVVMAELARRLQERRSQVHLSLRMGARHDRLDHLVEPQRSELLHRIHAGWWRALG